VAAQLDRATFRVIGNEALFEIARRAPMNTSELSTIKGMPKGMIERAGADIVAAIRHGMEVPEAELPKFPKGQRWNKDRDFDDKVNRLKAVRDAAATRPRSVRRTVLPGDDPEVSAIRAAARQPPN
jgi:ribonuclease D